MEIYLVRFGPFCDANNFRFVQLEFLIYENFDIYDFIENVINYNLINLLKSILESKVKIITINWLLGRLFVQYFVHENTQIWIVHYVCNNLIYLI